jgi:hypothetical protein
MQDCCLLLDNSWTVLPRRNGRPDSFILKSKYFSMSHDTVCLNGCVMDLCDRPCSVLCSRPCAELAPDKHERPTPNGVP